jgi:hypothetical protein
LQEDNIHRRTSIAAARRVIYASRYQVNSTAVNNILKKESWVPAVVRHNSVLITLALTHTYQRQNAFSDRLSPLGFDLHRMLLPDLMHEFELGVWRAVFIHLLRILEAVDESLLVS